MKDTHDTKPEVGADSFIDSDFILNRMIGNPGLKVICITPTHALLTDCVLPSFVLNPKLDQSSIKEFNRTACVIRLENGSEIRFKSYTDPNMIRGYEAHIGWMKGWESEWGMTSFLEFKTSLHLRLRLQGKCRKFLMISRSDGIIVDMEESLYNHG